MTIPADILAADAAGDIPDGISLSYLAQSRDHPAIVGIIFMVCFTGVLMILRLYARFFLVKHSGLDDALAVLTMVSLSIWRMHVHPHCGEKEKTKAGRYAAHPTTKWLVYNES